MFYVGSHLGDPNDGYVGSGKFFLRAFRKRPQDFKRRIIKVLEDCESALLFREEQKWLDLISPEELGKKYYNIKRAALGLDPLTASVIAKKRAKEGTLPGQVHAKNGTHHWFGGKTQRKNMERRTALGENPGTVASKNGSHNFFGLQTKLIEEGRHLLSKMNHTVYECPYCQKIGKGPIMKRYHFDNCKNVN